MNHLFGGNNAIRGTANRGAFFILAFILSFSLAAEQPNPDKEILNKLYEEIIGSSLNGKTMSMDSIRPDLERNPSETRHSTDTDPKAGNRIDERLDDEINKLIRDAHTRQADAVKFMQDGR